MNKKVTILVASHKPDTVFENDVYTPIHVGRAISKWKEEMSGMIGDDTGENISEKNPCYCELTAQYWAWKNLDCEYVGLCHYRRYFETEITAANIDEILGDHADVMLAKPLVDKRCMGNRLLRDSCREDVEIFMRCLKIVSPEMWDICYAFLNNNICYPFNMFVMKKVDFDEFAAWQFSVLEEMEKYVKLSGYTRMKRIYGYVGEMMLPMWCLYKKKKLVFNKVTSMIGQPSGPYSSIMRNTVRNILFKITREKIRLVDANDAVAVGFRADGLFQK